VAGGPTARGQLFEQPRLTDARIAAHHGDARPAGRGLLDQGAQLPKFVSATNESARGGSDHPSILADPTSAR
jgi:hypothetical protein